MRVNGVGLLYDVENGVKMVTDEELKTRQYVNNNKELVKGETQIRQVE